MVSPFFQFLQPGLENSLPWEPVSTLMVDNTDASSYFGRMAFARVPKESKAKIDRAGKKLANNSSLHGSELDRAWDLASQWRSCHAYPINTFQVTLRTKAAKHDRSAIVAQRLKRMATIINKLRRYPSMKLTRMQDIAGVRAIVSDVEKAEALAKDYLQSKQLAHTPANQKNYITNPRDEDGYRSIHLIYRYKNKTRPVYDGLRIEVQIRSRRQHIWATAVEAMGTFLGQDLKSREGDEKWLDFFALVSSAIAHSEERPPVPRFGHLSKTQTFNAVIDSEKALKARAIMTGLSVAVDHIKPSQAYFYHLIVLDSLNNRIQIVPYGRNSFAQAVHHYSKYEKRAAEGEKIEPVLVSAGALDQVRSAYPNFFLDIREFITLLNRIIAPR